MRRFWGSVIRQKSKKPGAHKNIELVLRSQAKSA
jgi:hypothetical protein